MAKLNKILLLMLFLLLDTVFAGKPAPPARKSSPPGRKAAPPPRSPPPTPVSKKPAHKKKAAPANFDKTEKDIDDIDREQEDFAFPPDSSELEEGFDDEPVISQKDEKFLQECAKKMTEECAKELVFAFIFEDMNVTKGCCDMLVKMGESCHLGLVKTVNQIPEYRPYAGKATERSKYVWNQCALVVDDEAEAPSPVPWEI